MNSVTILVVGTLLGVVGCMGIGKHQTGRHIVGIDDAVSGWDTTEELEQFRKEHGLAENIACVHSNCMPGHYTGFVDGTAEKFVRLSLEQNGTGEIEMTTAAAGRKHKAYEPVLWSYADCVIGITPVTQKGEHHRSKPFGHAYGIVLFNSWSVITNTPRAIDGIHLQIHRRGGQITVTLVRESIVRQCLQAGGQGL